MQVIGDTRKDSVVKANPATVEARCHNEALNEIVANSDLVCTEWRRIPQRKAPCSPNKSCGRPDTQPADRHNGPLFASCGHSLCAGVGRNGICIAYSADRLSCQDGNSTPSLEIHPHFFLLASGQKSFPAAVDYPVTSIWGPVTGEKKPAEQPLLDT
jgi:hypothetical protein